MNRLDRVAGATLVAVILAAVTAPSMAATDPTLNQVYDAVHAGHLDQAQSMMSEVLHDHPNSPKAHYVEAEILAKQGRTAEARSELDRAEQLAPGLPFASQHSVQELRGVIGSPAGNASSAPALAPVQHEAGFPWGIVLIGLIFVAIVIAIFRARRAAATYGANPVATPAYGSGYGIPPAAPMGGGMGSGILGGLATGAAVGAGMVAGEALAHELIDGHSGHPASAHDGAPLASDNDLGGQDFGISDAGSWDDGGSLGGGGGDDWN